MRTTARILTAAAAAAALITGAGLATAEHGTPSVEPEHVEAMILPGASLDVDKTVHTSEIPASPEIYFLVDTTGSMGPVISQVQADIGTITATIDAATGNSATYGIGEYKDFPFDPFAYQHLVSIGGDIGPAVAGLGAGGGNDGSEGQFFALDRIANANAAGFSGSGTQIVVWIGDAPAHDPVCSAISGLGYDITEASVTTDLGTAGLTVVAVSTTTGFYGAGLDDDPAFNAGDYSTLCSIGGTPGQATRITGATGGAALLNVPAGNVASAILAAISAVEVEVSMASDCELVTGGVISTTFTPASETVVSGESTEFVEKISVALDAPAGYYDCTDAVLIDGEPMLDESGLPVVETKTIFVPQHFVTGGGHVTNGEKGKNKVTLLNFGGNAGYMPDGTLVGHWHFDFKDAGVKVNTTEITYLQFFDDSSGDPAPPVAYANVANMRAEARVNVDNTGWVDGCQLSAYFRDNGEPQMDKVGGLEVTCSGGSYVFEDLTGGNIQIHYGNK